GVPSRAVRGPSFPSGYHNTQFWRPTPLDPRTHPRLFGLSALLLAMRLQLEALFGESLHHGWRLARKSSLRQCRGDIESIGSDPIRTGDLIELQPVCHADVIL